MAEFKVGDRVEYANPRGWVVRDGDAATVVNVDRHGQYQIVMDNPSVSAELSTRGWSPVAFHWTVGAGDLRPARPRKDTPAVGDTVRVVLEGKVFETGDNGGFSVTGLYWINPEAEEVKSIEILEPAKPSVKDLPGASVIRVKYLGVLERADHGWLQAGTTKVYTDAELDKEEWVQLVPQESA